MVGTVFLTDYSITNISCPHHPDIAYIIFLWQVERALHLKFPREVSMAGETDFVSCNMCLTIQVAQCMYEYAA